MRRPDEVGAVPGSCPLCLRADPARIRGRADGREYFLCGTCGLVHVPACFHPTSQAEADRYRLHQNDPDDPEYRGFLEQLAAPMSRWLEAGASGIDYGSGPSGVLAAMLRERGFRCREYDPVFSPGRLDPPYDFTACSEVFEHFRNPRQEILRVRDLLRPGGVLGVMTEFRPDEERFASWHYTSDPTHLCFYAGETFRWIAAHLGFRLLETDERRVALLERTGIDP